MIILGLSISVKTDQNPDHAMLASPPGKQKAGHQRQGMAASAADWPICGSRLVLDWLSRYGYYNGKTIKKIGCRLRKLTPSSQ